MDNCIINQLRFHRGIAKCKRADGSWQNAHFRQGDLDGACGAYSIAMAMNLLGLFEAEQMNDIDKVDRRTRIARLVYELDKHGLYSRGLTKTDIKRIVNKSYGKVVDVQYSPKNADTETIIQFAADMVNNNTPVIFEIDWDTENGHWVVIVGYEFDEKDIITNLLTLDPREPSPSSIDSLPRIQIRKGTREFRHNYVYPDKTSQKVRIGDAIAIKHKII